MFAQIATTTGTSPQPPRVGAPLDDEQQDDREAAPSRGAAVGARAPAPNDERGERQHGRAPHVSPRRRPIANSAAEDDADERRAQQHQPRPAAEPVDRVEDDLGAPLLVHPGRAGAP